MNFKFVHVEVPKDVLVERFIKRTEATMASLGMNLAQSWALPGPEMEAIRAKYGNEYSEASYKQMTRETVFGYDYSWLANESDVMFVKN